MQLAAGPLHVSGRTTDENRARADLRQASREPNIDSAADSPAERDASRSESRRIAVDLWKTPTTLDMVPLPQGSEWSAPESGASVGWSDTRVNMAQLSTLCGRICGSRERQTDDGGRRCADRLATTTAILAEQVSDGVYTATFKDIRGLYLDENCLTIEVPTKFIKDRIDQRYRELILAALADGGNAQPGPRDPRRGRRSTCRCDDLDDVAGRSDPRERRPPTDPGRHRDASRRRPAIDPPTSIRSTPSTRS